MATSQASAILSNIVTRVEATTPNTALGGRTTFRHIESAYFAEDLADLKDPTRAFVVELTGDVGEGPALLRQTDFGPPRRVVHDVVVVYRQPKNAWTLSKAIAEDVDDLTHALEQVGTTNYDETNTKLWRRQVTGSSIEFDEGSGGVAFVRLSVACDYLPEFS